MGATMALSNSRPLTSFDNVQDEDSFLFSNSKKSQLIRKAIVIMVGCLVLFSSYILLFNRVVALTLANTAGKATLPYVPKDHHSGDSMKVPDYFQTTPELWPGPTATGKAPFLAETNPVSFAATVTYVPNTPLETAVPIVGQGRNQTIFKSMGHVSSYFPNPEGFGVAEFPLPDGANITQFHMLHRHGSRYPTSGLQLVAFAQRVAKTKFTASGALAFLNNWRYELGAEILVPRGRQELFDSGILHYYQYGQLYDPNTKIIARTTTQDRMLKSAEYFMAGFFGLEWTRNVTLELIIEDIGFNNSLAGYDNCPNAFSYRNRGGNNASTEWVHIYLQDATKRLQTMIKDFDWTVEDTYAAQTLCPYETVAYGYSAFCDLFTYTEWEGFEYAQDLYFAGSAAFQSPTARAVGLGYIQELHARLSNRTLSYSPTNPSQINSTLDSSTSTFPLNQTLYFDFSHDTNIMSVLTAFNFTQFSGFLPSTHIPSKSERNLTVSRVTPFAARVDIEVIKTPWPVDGKTREYVKSGTKNGAEVGKSGVKGEETTYIHFLINQRTLPLGHSYKSCGDRIDGWCEIKAFLEELDAIANSVDYVEDCFAEWEVKKYGDVMDGRSR